MEKHVNNRKTNRREILKLSGMGVLGGIAANTLISGKAKAAEEPANISYASWIHGNTMQVEYPESIARHVRIGWGAEIEGMPGTTNWFHIAVPTPVIINDIRMQADTIIMDFRTGSIDAFIRDIHIYDGGYRIAVFDGLNLSLEQPDYRLVLPNTPQIFYGLGISLGVGFGVESMDHSMTFYAAGCDFVIRPLPEVEE